LNESKKSAPVLGESIFAAISIGFFLVLVGAIFAITPNLFGELIELLKDFKLVDVPNTDIIFPAPEFPVLYSTVYQAARQFSIALAIFQVVILALRFVIPSSWEKRSETVGNLVFWLGTVFLIQSFLLETTQWFVFWSTIIMLIGVSLIARAGAMAVAHIT
jgi:hypothetical protein